MQDTEATKLVQQGVTRDSTVASVIEMGLGAPEQSDTLMTDFLIRGFWKVYGKLMALDDESP